MAITSLIAMSAFAYWSSRRSSANKLASDEGPASNGTGSLRNYLGSFVFNAYDTVAASLSPEREVTLLILGLDSAGKSTILSSIANYQPSRPPSRRPSATIEGQEKSKDPTMDEVPITDPPPPEVQKEESPYLFDIQEVSHPTQPNLLIRFWDLSGTTPVRDMWRCYLGPANALIFVVDAADRSRAAEAGAALLNVLRPSTEDEADGLSPDAAVLILSNKHDLDGAMSNGELCEAMGLLEVEAAELLETRSWSVCQCSGKTSEGIVEALEWLADSFLGKKQQPSMGDTWF
ncbi:ADP-ribosylation factor family-domain-containing protein [Cladochytrium replicatum]|nr:ADP-ribosylation factor family-domain-containing protein [Cladochytrium replicatum]